MNLLLARFLRTVYRKEPISGFLLILGITDTLIGSFGGRWSLLTIGLLVAILGAAMRWRHVQKLETVVAKKPARHLLPPGSSAQPLPLLMSNKRHKS